MRIAQLAAISIIIIVAMAVFVSGVSVAEGICGGRKAALEYLQRQYQERPRALGLAANARVVELLVAKTGSWTILVTRPDGISCVVASGEAWEALPEVAEEPAS